MTMSGYLQVLERREASHSIRARPNRPLSTLPLFGTEILQVHDRPWPTDRPVIVTPRRDDLSCQLAAPWEPLLQEIDDKGIQSLVLTGCVGNEGCTFVTRRLGEVLACRGRRVLCVDTHDPLVAWDSPGSYRDPSKGGAAPILCPGSDVREPRALKWFRDQLRRYDHVLFDTAAPRFCQHAMILGRWADAVIIVARSRRTETRALLAVRAQLELASARVLGVVLNGLRSPGAPQPPPARRRAVTHRPGEASP